MESSNMKNMVVLKNLPSNMVEEAIIIFKETQKVKQKELIDKSNGAKKLENKSKSKECIVKEAEMLVSEYINKIEKIPKLDYYKEIYIKYKYLKKYSIFSTIILIVSLIINFI